VSWTGTSTQCDAVSGTHTVRIDEPPALGGTNTGMNPVELLLSSLGGCLIVLVHSFASTYEVDVKGVSVDVEGDLDPDGFMGRAPVRAGFSEIRYKVNVDSDSDPEKIAALIAHAENSCPIKDTLSGVPVNPMPEEELVAESI
jgi:uncharacterized OsmC-like protein